MSYVIGVNRTGVTANNYTYSGNSVILDCFGEELSNLKKNEIGIVSATIERKNLKDTREKLGFLNDMDSFKILDTHD
jgi:predicted amidohydrolase